MDYSSKSEETRQLMLKESEDGFSAKKDEVWYIFYNDAIGGIGVSIIRLLTNVATLC